MISKCARNHWFNTIIGTNAELLSIGPFKTGFKIIWKKQRYKNDICDNVLCKKLFMDRCVDSTDIVMKENSVTWFKTVTVANGS